MKVKFGLDSGLLIQDYNTKKKIISFLFSSINLSKYRYNIMENLQKLKFLQQKEHYVSPNFRGINYLLVFLNINQKKYCVAIDKKNLSYHQDKIDYSRLNLIKLKVNVSDSIFMGTIFDGKLIHTKNFTYFLIKDCYYLMNNSLENMEMLQKMIHLDNIIRHNFKGKSTCSNFIFKLNSLKKYQDIKKIIESKNDSKIQIVGLEFFPKFSGISIIYLDKNNEKNNNVKISNSKFNKPLDKNIENFSYELIHNLPNILNQRIYSYENDKNQKVFYLDKTNISDVFNLYDNLKNKKKLGIAHIPNFKTSQMCRKYVIDGPRKFSCVYNKKFKKWIPIELIE